MTAAALSHSFGRQVEEALLESEKIGTVGSGDATISKIHRFTSQSARGSFKLDIEFVDWLHPGHR